MRLSFSRQVYDMKGTIAVGIPYDIARWMDLNPGSQVEIFVRKKGTKKVIEICKKGDV